MTFIILWQQPWLVGTNIATYRSWTNIIANSDFLFANNKFISSAITGNSPHTHIVLVMSVLYVFSYRNLSIWLQDLPYKVSDFYFCFFNSLCQSPIFLVTLLFSFLLNVIIVWKSDIMKGYLVIYHSSSSFSSIILAEDCKIIWEGCTFRK